MLLIFFNHYNRTNLLVFFFFFIKVGLSRVLQAIISFKGVMIEWVIVKGFNEPINPNSLQQELWQESRYCVFRKITDHANAAMLHFSSPTLPDLSVRSFMVLYYNSIKTEIKFYY